ncbi:hypothetical protein LTR62_002951 [Meristemomyces frigidus]|uniref:RNA helicase n=1 Tax=Meristemomyces frigidus TaxID=1508187 RepID=A0AAN7TQQ0_9PEZI|nr:hypothetical protein LTR62_002951 [Meristemomyces frigidus]
MFRLSPSICPFCDASALFKASRPQWQSSRGAATLQQRRPSRMTLAAHVTRGPQEKDSAGAPVRKSRNSPFGGMNITEPPRRAGQGFQQRKSPAEQRRGGRFAKTGASGVKGKDGERKEPMKALKMQRALANVSYEKRGRVKQELMDRDSFDGFDLLPTINQSISAQALGGLASASPTPTPIQRLAIPALLGTEDGRRRKRKEVESEYPGMQQFLLAAETGSGKTLAYILPIIDALKRAEKAEQETERSRLAQEVKKQHLQPFELETPVLDEINPSSGRPRAIILLPTSELVAQVGALVKNLSHTVKFRSAMISANFTSTVIRSRLFSPSGIDVVIATPHLLSSIAESDPNVLSRVTHLVIDEADSLLDRSFAPITSSLVDRATPSLKQIILCSATIPKSLDSYLHKRFPDVMRLVTPNLHAIPRRVQLSVVDIDKVPFQGNRDLACAQTIWDIGKEAQEQELDLDEERGQRKIVVFVNERSKATELATYLRSKGIDATGLTRDSDERRQAEVLAAFTGAALSPATQKQLRDSSSSSSQDPASRPFPRQDQDVDRVPARELKGTKVLVMTDLGSRGIDTLLVKHVILYDVPHTSIDFIHRLGRVGRMGRRGRGIVLVGGSDRKDVVREVREGMFRGQALI